MFEELKSNIVAEMQILTALRGMKDGKVRQSYINQLKGLNNAVPDLLKRSSPVKSVNTAPIDLVSMKFSNGSNVYVKKGESGAFKTDTKVLLKDKKATSLNYAIVNPSIVKTLSNRFFRKSAEKMMPFMKGFVRNIKMANLSVLPSTYIAMMFLFTFFSIFLGIGAYGVLLILGYWNYFWVILAVPLLTFAGFYMYPQSESSTVQKAIAYELPFATIHMTAIAGSDIEPSKIFQIISDSKEYPNVGREMQKIIVLIRLYGYDLVTALKNVAARTSNSKLAELYGGLATNISSGGQLKSYLEKKAESYLLDYRLERRKYIDLASTFMDIYISILIAAPMVLMLMFIVMNVAGLGFEGVSIDLLLLISIIAIVIVNILFLIAINLKQPKV
jgi:Flp pilus assembly protein TadB